MRYGLAISSGGTRLQAGIAKGNPKNSPFRAHGMTLQAVVIAVYPYDTETSPDEPTTNTIYCDVMCYGKHEGVLKKVLVTWERQGMHEGSIYLPRAASMVIDQTLNPLKTNPSNMDGDHVLIGFLEDKLDRPYIQKYVAHPSSDIGNDGRDLGHRMRITTDDGTPRLWKHKGSFWGIDADGNYVLDLTRAHLGTYEADGSEPDPALDGVSGNFAQNMPEKSTLRILMGDDREFLLEEEAGAWTVTLNGGPIKFTSDSVNLDTAHSIKLGSGASTEKVVLGTTWTTARGIRSGLENAAWTGEFTFMNLWAPARAALVGSIGTPTALLEIAKIPTLWGALMTFLTAITVGAAPQALLAQTAATGINTFEAGTYLSAEVVVKP